MKQLTTTKRKRALLLHFFSVERQCYQHNTFMRIPHTLNSTWAGFISSKFPKHLRQRPFPLPMDGQQVSRDSGSFAMGCAMVLVGEASMPTANKTLRAVLIRKTQMACPLKAFPSSPNSTSVNKLLTTRSSLTRIPLGSPTLTSIRITASRKSWVFLVRVCWWSGLSVLVPKGVCFVNPVSGNDVKSSVLCVLCDLWKNLCKN